MSYACAVVDRHPMYGDISLNNPLTSTPTDTFRFVLPPGIDSIV